ncbi:MAG: NAD(+) synthase [Sphaerochaeta sp.]|uniref:NAD(+) synthase n=1 Tax=Sphaerochaeta sp. TaxID=1972642 RepID=UPI003D0B1259
MNDGFITCAVASPSVRVADCRFNTESILQRISEAVARQVRLLVLPELVVTSYSCADLFFQTSLQEGALEALQVIVEESRSNDLLLVLGCPLVVQSRLYNCAVVVQKGRILGIVPKQNLPNYQEFYEKRWFAVPEDRNMMVDVLGQETWFGTRLLFTCSNLAQFVLACEVCEDLWVPQAPSVDHALAGATVIVNCSASDELVGKEEYRRSLVSGQSARLVAAYLYSDAGEGESSTDLVFCPHNLIYEDGIRLAEQFGVSDALLVTEIDVQKLALERMRLNNFKVPKASYQQISFSLSEKSCTLTRYVDKAPFVPQDEESRALRCEKILTLQALGLKKRLMHTKSQRVVVGLSGGLDSTLALLVSVRSFDLLKLDRSNILAVTMPGFGTTKRTRGNATKLAKALGVELQTISIAKAVAQHFKDIDHDPEVLDVTYENSQARERTQVLMDLANKLNALVVGTGDLSELALGWATYNGDHMSMYGVNASVPKTLVRHLVKHVASISDAATRKVLLDIVATPVSPELLPAHGDGTISQVTEDLVGPYELHDFFLYQAIRWGFSPQKVYRLALKAFEGQYEPAFILKWLKTFYRRFFTQQFKRSCMPDGPKIGSLALSPRGDWRMNSDASYQLWMTELDRL